MNITLVYKPGMECMACNSWPCDCFNPLINERDKKHINKRRIEMGLENVKLAVRPEDIGTKEGDAWTAQISGEVKEISTKFGKKYVVPLTNEQGEFEFYAKERDAQVLVRKYGVKLKDYLGKDVRLVLDKYEFEKDGTVKTGLSIKLEA